MRSPRPRLCDKSLRVPRNRQRAIHWIDQTGTVSCRTPITAECMADGRAVHVVEEVTCAACLKVIEIQYEPDYLGSEKPPVPTTKDWGPLFSKTMAVLLCALLAVACKQPDPLGAVGKMPTQSAESFFGAAPLVDRMVAQVLPIEGVCGVMRMIPTPSQCRMAGGVLPYVWPTWTEPRAGKPLHIQWVARACRPIPGEEQAVLMVSDRPREDGPLDVSPWGHFGCWLAVNPDVVLVPGVTGILVRQPDTGVIDLWWTPDPALVGKSFYVQLLIATYETESRLAVSPALEVTIGSPAP